jgi:hypothetical protein
MTLFVYLSYVFNSCIKLCYFPKIWKHASVIPIPKPGKDHSNPLNYCPISLWSSISKVFERIIPKAFDSVWHEALLHKLLVNDCDIFLARLFFSFLKNRSFQVCIGGSKSFSYNIPYGVPQGAILSLTLYNIFTSDVPTMGECELATFADDTAIFVSGIDTAEVCCMLKRQLDTLSDYFKNWKIRVDVSVHGCFRPWA